MTLERLKTELEDLLKDKYAGDDPIPGEVEELLLLYINEVSVYKLVQDIREA